MTETPEPTWGDTFRTHRIDAGYSLRGLADALGVDVTSITHWQSGRRVPTADYHDRLRELLPHLPAPSRLIEYVRRGGGVEMSGPAKWHFCKNHPATIAAPPDAACMSTGQTCRKVGQWAVTVNGADRTFCTGHMATFLQSLPEPVVDTPDTKTNGEAA